MQIVPIILSGGAGTRLWPVSREALPKPFMRVGERTLLQRTMDRAWAVPGVQAAAVVTNVAYAYKTAEELMNQDGAPAISLLLEPFGKNTAPAVALAALWTQTNAGDDAVMLVMPADHLMENEREFVRAIEDAARIAVERQSLVLFGITPTGPETGFGYIEWGPAVADDLRGHAVNRFVEKPSRDKAKEYIAAGNFVWNSGMFCFTVKTILAAFAEHAPDVLAVARKVAGRTALQSTQVTFESAEFEKFKDISIDYAVMEKARNVVVVPYSHGWSDIGSWKAVAETQQADAAGNVTEGKAIFVNTRGTYVRAESRVVAAVGVEDLIVVDTPDAILVAHKNASQDVKEVVRALREQGNEAYKLHTTVHRPWGSYTTLLESEGFKIKRIVVKPGQALSLQFHHHRAEHWVVVRGQALVQVGDEVLPTKVGQSRYIPVGEKHRLTNPGTEDVEIIEVQCGTYLGEDDIVRLVDNYGRA
jgi:mannose-1-phosphate guanylyltransferase